MQDQDNLERSIRRTQNEISDIVDCNDFHLFGTLTYDSAKIDRYDDQAIYTATSKWLNNQRRNSPDLIYLLVPERHKDGALHFHALIGAYNAHMELSGKKWQGIPIYNLPAWKYGFTNFTAIRDKAKTANYCRKYITKALMTDKNKRRYWASKNLKKPERIENLELIDLANYPIDLKNLQSYENEHVTTTTFPLKRQNSPK